MLAGLSSLPAAILLHLSDIGHMATIKSFQHTMKANGGAAFPWPAIGQRVTVDLFTP